MTHILPGALIADWKAGSRSSEHAAFLSGAGITANAANDADLNNGVANPGGGLGPNRLVTMSVIPDAAGITGRWEFSGFRGDKAGAVDALVMMAIDYTGAPIDALAWITATGRVLRYTRQAVLNDDRAGTKIRSGSYPSLQMFDGVESWLLGDRLGAFNVES